MSLGDGLIAAGARLVELDLSENAFGPAGVEGVTSLLTSEVCYTLKVLKFNNNGLGIGGGKVRSPPLVKRPIKIRSFFPSDPLSSFIDLLPAGE